MNKFYLPNQVVGCEKYLDNFAIASCLEYI